jgi:hypothetical protein
MNSGRQTGDRQGKSVGSAYGGRMCFAGVSRVVRTMELQGTTGCHGNLMENCNKRTRRGSFGQTKPLA